MQTQGDKTSSPTGHRPTSKRECHKCPLNGKGDSYCFEKCLGPADDSRKGRSMVSLGGMPAEDEYIYAKADKLCGVPSATIPTFMDDIDAPRETAPSALQPQGVVDKMPYDTERYLVRVLATVMSLPDIQLCIFRHAYLGERFESIGNTLPVRMTKQAVSKHIKTMRLKHPIFDRLLAQLVKSPANANASARRKATAEAARRQQAWLDEADRAEYPMPSNYTVQLDLFSGVAVDGIYRRGWKASGKGRAKPVGSSATSSVTRTRETQCTPTSAELSR